MKKYELRARESEINWKDRESIKPGCTAEELEYGIIQSFDTLKEAREALTEYKTEIRQTGGNHVYYVVTEYSIESVEYNEDGDLVDSGDIIEFSEMKIEVVEKPSYKTIATCSNYEEAEEAKASYDGDDEVFLSFN